MSVAQVGVSKAKKLKQYDISKIQVQVQQNESQPIESELYGGRV